ncbi:hypothetical protein N0V94_006562 [Neodidymelliopsis sp. IMI 364377]|nr:hypothetical protein N0V94_006562 [Neodidymelliopsis sp. IMI 364377]
MDVEAINLRNQRNSPLLRLPPEVRNRIYTYALSGYTFDVRECEGNLVFKNLIHGQVSSNDVPHYGPKTLQETCRFVRYETGNMVFTLNIFRFHTIEPGFNMTGLRFFAHHSLDSRLQSIRFAHINLRRRGYSNLRNLAQLKELERVEIADPALWGLHQSGMTRALKMFQSSFDSFRDEHDQPVEIVWG